MGIPLNIKKWVKRSRFLALQKGMATVIVTGNNLPVNVTQGQYVLIQDSTITGVNDGLYKATGNISAGTLSDGNNLSVVSSGLCGEVASLSDQIATKADFASGEWTPTFGRDTATNIYASWYRIGKLLFITAEWKNTHGVSGASYIEKSSIPVPAGYHLGYGCHGTWRSNTTDIAGEIGQYNENQNMRFSKAGVGVELPNEAISFNAIALLAPN